MSAGSQTAPPGHLAAGTRLSDSARRILPLAWPGIVLLKREPSAIV